MIEKDMFEFILSEYDEMLLKEVKNLGGFCNFHCHLDRCNTLDRRYLRTMGIDPITAAAILPLSAKQNLVGDLHLSDAYKKENLKRRIKKNIEDQCKMMTTEIITFIDATPDLIQDDQLVTLSVMSELKEEMKDKLKIQIAIHPVFGFKPEDSGEEKRWNIYKDIARYTDILGGLPEKDSRTDSIGFEQHIKRILTLGCELQKPVHIHLDQQNTPSEIGSKLLVEGIKWIGSPKIENTQGPTVYIIHCISPSAYIDEKFYKLVDRLLKYNIGIIVCPSAALSMYQVRHVISPTHNSIARVLELIEAGVTVKVATDNITDIFVCSSDGSMLTELKILSHAIRFYVIGVLAKLGAGKDMNQMDRKIVRDVLQANKEIAKLYEN